MNKTKAVIFSVIAVLLISSLSAVVTVFPLGQSATCPQNSAANMSNRLLNATWVRFNGVINQWSTTAVKGEIQTQARAAFFNSSDPRQFAGATAIWTTDTSRAIQSVKDRENFTYVFYTARLVNASVSTVSATSTTQTYFINGTWNFATATSNVTIITNADNEITRVLRNQDTSYQKVYGELTITGNTFNLTLSGQDALTGTVFRTIQRTWFNPFQMNPDATSNAITRTDVKTIAQCYGAVPGWGNFDLNMDFNNNYKVDIADVSTVASQM